MDFSDRFRQIDDEVSREARSAAERQQGVTARLAEEMGAASAAVRDAAAALSEHHIPKVGYYTAHRSRWSGEREFRYSVGVARQGWTYGDWVLTDDSRFFHSEAICTQQPKLLRNPKAHWSEHARCVCESAAIANNNPFPFVREKPPLRKSMMFVTGDTNGLMVVAEQQWDPDHRDEWSSRTIAPFGEYLGRFVEGVYRSGR